MADIITYPENGITYDADDAAGYLATRQSGVYSAEEDFAVTAVEGLSVSVSAGHAWVHPSRWLGRSIIMEQPTTVVLTEADPVRTRIDRIVLRYDAAAKKTRLVVLEGTPDSAEPVAPDITRTALVYDLCLAEIKRTAGSTAITAADITDTRADETVCGVMRDGVQGIPAATLIQQLRAEIDKVDKGSFYDKEETDALLDALQEQVAKASANIGQPIVVWSAYHGFGETTYTTWSTTVPDDTDFIVIKNGGYNKNATSIAIYRNQPTAAFGMSFTFSADGTFAINCSGGGFNVYCIGYHYVDQIDGLKVPIVVGSARLNKNAYSMSSCVVDSSAEYAVVEWRSSSVLYSVIAVRGNTELKSYYFSGDRFYADASVGELYVTFYRYASLDDLTAQQTATQAAQADTDAMTVDQEYRIALLELGITDEIT